MSKDAEEETETGRRFSTDAEKRVGSEERRRSKDRHLIINESMVRQVDPYEPHPSDRCVSEVHRRRKATDVRRMTGAGEKEFLRQNEVATLLAADKQACAEDTADCASGCVE